MSNKFDKIYIIRCQPGWWIGRFGIWNSFRKFKIQNIFESYLETWTFFKFCTNNKFGINASIWKMDSTHLGKGSSRKRYTFFARQILRKTNLVWQRTKQIILATETVNLSRSFSSAFYTPSYTLPTRHSFVSLKHHYTLVVIRLFFFSLSLSFLWCLRWLTEKWFVTKIQSCRFFQMPGTFFFPSSPPAPCLLPPSSCIFSFLKNTSWYACAMLHCHLRCCLCAFACKGFISVTKVLQLFLTKSPSVPPPSHDILRDILIIHPLFSPLLFSPTFTQAWHSYSSVCTAILFWLSSTRIDNLNKTHFAWPLDFTSSRHHIEHRT